MTRDEAIAIVLETMPEPVDQACEHHLRGIRLTLEALAAAGAFSDMPLEAGSVGLAVMRDKLDAAGIR